MRQAVQKYPGFGHPASTEPTESVALVSADTRLENT
jgi:hypothetical protein